MWSLSIMYAVNEYLIISCQSNICIENNLFISIYHTMKPTSIFLCVLLFVCSYSLWQEPNTCQQPLITEYLKNFEVPVNDLQTLISTNISSLTVPAVSGKGATFSQTKCVLTYIGGKVISKKSTYEYQVSNDSFSVKLKWTAKVSRTVGSKQYNMTASIQSVKVNYVKTYISSTNSFQVSNVTYLFSPDMITNQTYDPSPPTDADKTKVESVIKNQQYNAINQQFKSLSQWLNDNAKKQKLATVYPEDIYAYEFYGWTLNIDTRTLVLVPAEDNSFINGYRGDIVGSVESFCPQKLYNPQGSSSMYISLEFIQNFAKAVVQRYPPYQSLKINGSWVRTETFQFRLVDLEYVLHGAYDKYPTLYMNPISFTCSAKELVSGYITNKTLSQLVKWQCFGHLWVNSTNTEPILDGQITVSHEMNVRVNGDSLSVYSNTLKVTDAIFKPVGSITVKDAELAKIYMQEFLNDFRTYTPGTWFRVKKGSVNVEIQSDHQIGAGLWIV